MSSASHSNVVKSVGIAAEGQKKGGITGPIMQAHDPSVRCEYEQLRREAHASILLIEPRLLMRELMSECLKRYIGDPIDAEVHVARTLAESVETARKYAPSVVILSCLGQPAEDRQYGPDLREIREVFPQVPIVLIADGDCLDDVHRAIEQGARGYIPTSTPPAVAIGAIRLVVAGGVYVPASCLLSARQGDAPLAAFSRSKLPMFTTRQAAVVDALRKGKANKLIAYELNMRESTVKVHVRNIMKRLNAKNRTEVAYMASKLMGEDSL